jgi:hypothetical protein
MLTYAWMWGTISAHTSMEKFVKKSTESEYEE